MATNGHLVCARRGKKHAGMHPSRARSISRRAPKLYDIRAHSFLPTPCTGAAKAGQRGRGAYGWRKGRERHRHEDSRENYRLGCTALKSASSPLTGGLNFSPTRRAPGTGCARLRPPPTPVLPRFPPSARNPYPGSSSPPDHHQPATVPSISRGQHFCSRGGELPVATARRDGDARMPRPRWN